MRSLVSLSHIFSLRMDLSGAIQIKVPQLLMNVEYSKNKKTNDEEKTDAIKIINKRSMYRYYHGCNWKKAFYHFSM